MSGERIVEINGEGRKVERGDCIVYREELRLNRDECRKENKEKN